MSKDPIFGLFLTNFVIFETRSFSKKKIILYHTHPQMGINTMEKVSGKSKDPIPRRLWEKMTDRWKDEMTP